MYSTPDNIYGDSVTNPDNSCYDTEDYKAPKGLQNISPCQYSKCWHSIVIASFQIVLLINSICFAV